MDRKELTSELSVGEQINPDDLQILSDSGFRSIICNRPDGESSDCLLYTSPSPRDATLSRMPSSA